MRRHTARARRAAARLADRTWSKAARDGHEGTQCALAAERLRTGRLLARIRLAGITVAFALNWVLPKCFAEGAHYQSSLGIFGIYWVVAASLCLAGLRSERMARLVGLDVALLDMPAAFALQLSASGRAGDPVAGVLAITYFAALILASCFSLQPRRIVLAGAVGVVLGVCLLWVNGAAPTLMVMATLVMAGTALGCHALTARTIELVRGVADEQRRRLRLAGYVSPQVAARAESLVDESAPGENRTVTVLFADLRGFTAMSETLPSDCVVSLLNEFHSRMVAAVSACEGTFDKYLGDGLMAYFGAPVPAADHAVRAILCALSMQISLGEMNAARAARGEPPLRMGVGLHSGPVVLGDIGAPGRREYTPVGDTVNVAARIEELTRNHGFAVLVSDETRRLAGEAFPFQPVSPLAVRGKRECIRCWTPQWTRGWCVANTEMADVGNTPPAGPLRSSEYHG
ncbi:MAG TPA: adenylate/guanylate cyclase domain-containing protein [Candidatus Binatia bacterium]|nr:adenylate/guanylate cyclase domain-containing protein [Candidatus Binatia bacterium]